jgi:translation initiation factor IF-2
MADVTVNDLATLVGTSVERLLGQMKDAGLNHGSATDLVSDSEKKTLLASLKASHGEDDSAPKKITLKRKTTSTLKFGSGSARKSVNVEVRKKRTYVKRDESGDAEIVELEVEVEDALVPDTVEVVEAVDIPQVADVVEVALTEEVEAEPEVVDIEVVVAPEPTAPAPRSVRLKKKKPRRKTFLSLIQDKRKPKLRL